MNLKKIILIILGTISLVVGIIGIVVPGLPTTTFLLIASACYVRSSEKLYSWLINHKIYGKFIKDYQQHKAITKNQKMISIVSMWLMISISILFFIDISWVKIVLLLCGITGTIIVLSIRTLSKQNL